MAAKSSTSALKWTPPPPIPDIDDEEEEELDLNWDPETGYISSGKPFDQLSIPEILYIRKINGQTGTLPELKKVGALSIRDQAKYYPPAGWTEVFKKMHKGIHGGPSEFKLIQRNLDTKLKGEYYPSPSCLIFAAFHYTPLLHTKVVIIGQDPYIHFGQATGLCFSVREGVEIPPSLKNIFTQIRREYPDFVPYRGGDLTHWAQQGVLMLNTGLTVRPQQADSHKGLWSGFLSQIIKAILETVPGVIFVLWGGHAQKYVGEAIGSRAVSLKATHPSPKSAYRASMDTPAFMGCGHFKQINEYLVGRGEWEVRW
jgi:uracil-DNA glycosylase